MNRAALARKVETLDDLKDIAQKRRWEEQNNIVIEKVIELYEADYEDFASDLFEDQEFIRENSKLMYVDQNGFWHCIFVKQYGAIDGILVQAEGYSYARYSAYYIEEGPTMATLAHVHFPVKEVEEIPFDGSEATQGDTGDHARVRKQIVIRIDGDLHLKLKMYAVENSTTIQKLIEKYLARLVG